MADIFEPKVRSYVMSRVKGKNTKPEMLVRRYLYAKGFRYRLHDKNLPGKPDIVLKKYRTLIFINGCFWHAHENCRHFKVPETNTKFWRKKIGKNVLNDLRNHQALEELGWRVLVLWTCELKPKVREKRLEALEREILNGMDQSG